MIQGSYAPGWVGISIVVAVIASYTAIAMARRMASASGRGARWWLAGGALAMGTGIWAMHFVGMLAFSLPMPMGYDAGITALSWAIGVAAAAFALWLTARTRLTARLLALGAAVMGGGIAGMHYTGMAAMLMQPGIRYAPGLFALSLAVAVLVSGIGLQLLHALRTAHQRGPWLHAAAALLMGLSIVGMHYIGMAAAHFPPGSICGAAQGGLHTGWLASLIVLGSLGMLTMALVVAVLDQRLEARTTVLAASLARANRELSHLSLHDTLTRLPNRRLLAERLEQSIAARAPFALLMLDLDGFKAVNNVFGHATGDLLLVDLAQRLETLRGPTDIVARLGGDEFALQVHGQSRAQADALAQHLLALLRQPATINGHSLQLAASVGIARYPGDGADAASLLANAEAAMYDTKDNHRNGYRFFVPAMNRQAQWMLELSLALAPALQRGEFHLQYQPKYAAADHRLVGVEALVRWDRPGRGMVAPDVFIPLAERSGLIVPLGAWILDEACRQLAAWQRQGRDVQMSVNLSVLQFCSPHLVEEIAACLARHAIAPRQLTLEITESVAMQDVEHSLRMLRQLGQLGVHIAIDDFGTGYSSLAYLKRLPASELKIDRSFVQNLEGGHEDAAIVATIIAMGKTLGLTVTAEGVETAAQRDFLVRQGCDILQGYLLGRPVRAEAISFGSPPTPHDMRRPAPAMVLHASAM